MSFDEIDLLVRRANPVPDPDLFGPVHRTDEETEPEGGAMTTTTPRPERPTTPRHRPDAPPARPRTRALLVAAAAVLAVLAVGWGATRGSSDDSTIATQPTELADAFVRAYADQDVDAVLTLVGGDALAQLGGVEGLRSTFRWNAATGFEILPEPCEPVASGTTSSAVRCPYAFHGLRSAELGSDPYVGGHFELGVAGGRIASVVDDTDFEGSGFAREVAEPFLRWLTTTHPGDVTSMFADSDLTHPRRTETATQLWERRTQEYVDEVAG